MHGILKPAPTYLTRIMVLRAKISHKENGVGAGQVDAETQAWKEEKERQRAEQAAAVEAKMQAWMAAAAAKTEGK